MLQNEPSLAKSGVGTAENGLRKGRKKGARVTSLNFFMEFLSKKQPGKDREQVPRVLVDTVYGICATVFLDAESPTGRIWTSS